MTTQKVGRREYRYNVEMWFYGTLSHVRRVERAVEELILKARRDMRLTVDLRSAVGAQQEGANAE